MPKVNYSSRYTENPPRLDRWDGLSVYLDEIFIVTMLISRIENRVETYMPDPNFFTKNLPISLFTFLLKKATTFFNFLCRIACPKCQALLFQNKENSHASAFVV